MSKRLMTGLNHLLLCGLAGGGLMSASGTLHAESASNSSYIESIDPTGGAMCFTKAGAKAPLDACDTSPGPFAVTSDPSGAVMCFDALGEKAPLEACGVLEKATQLVRDPSGAPMCVDDDGQPASLSACSEQLSASIEPRLLDSLPDENAVAVAVDFTTSVEEGSVAKFTKLLHPRGLHHGQKKIATRAIASVVRTLGVASFVDMPSGKEWNVRASDSWFSVFRGDQDGRTTVAYFEMYRGKWRLVQLARVAFTETASR